MANTFKLEATDNLARIASALVSKDLVLGRTVRHDFSAEFAGKRNTSVNVRVPATISASRRSLDTNTSLTVAALTESYQTVYLTDNVYSAVELTQEDLTLRLEDFTEQVLGPQALAIAEDIEELVVAKMQSIAETDALDTLLTVEDASTVVPTFIEARKILRDQGAPASGLYAAVSTDVYASLLRAQVVAGNNGGQGDALANATVGRVAGFTVVESNRLDTGEIIFYHRDAIALVLRAPVVPNELADGASVMAQGGVPVSISRSWDNDALAMRQVLNVYAGTATVNAKMSTDSSSVLFALRVKDGS